MKYLIIANIASQNYAIDNMLFGIFDHKEEAIQYIIDNPVYSFNEFETFDFFENYSENKYFEVFDRDQDTFFRFKLTKEQYAERYIQEFNNSPISVGCYYE